MLTTNLSYSSDHKFVCDEVSFATMDNNDVDFGAKNFANSPDPNLFRS